jgi:8-oxo-dGTP diphosphatase
VKGRATLICRRAKELLFVRRGSRKWQLPGGKIKPNEMPLQAAHRELAEETGLSSSSMILIARHAINEVEHFIFVADVPSDAEAKPDNEIDECAWIPYRSATNKVKASARELLGKFIADLKAI